MKKSIYFVYGIYVVVISVVLLLSSGMAQTDECKKHEIYFIDSDMFRLVSVDFVCSEANVEHCAEEVLDELILGRDYNNKITRMIPNIANCMSVKVEDSTAIVDMKSKSFEYFPDGRVSEALIIYQIVNSLTSVDGIDKVQFTIDGERVKDFKGFIDMRETFIPDYYV